MGLRAGKASGYNRPEVLGVLACGTASARPSGLLKGVLLTEHAGTKVLTLWCLSIGLEAGGQLGVVRATVSWV